MFGAAIGSVNRSAFGGFFNFKAQKGPIPDTMNLGRHRFSYRTSYLENAIPDWLLGGIGDLFPLVDP